MSNNFAIPNSKAPMTSYVTLFIGKKEQKYFLNKLLDPPRVGTKNNSNLMIALYNTEF
jgi:hypothetical protein